MSVATSRDGARLTSDRDQRFRLALADRADREEIYQLRHAVYAAELGQHPENTAQRLTDELDTFNHYLMARVGDRLAGFVSITPPGFGRYSIDKYFARSALPFPVDDGLFEIRILTVDPAFRGTAVAGLLMYAAFRWVEEHGAARIVGIGRKEIISLYVRAGLRRLGMTVRSGAVSYELMSAPVTDLRANLRSFGGLMKRTFPAVEWSLAMPIERPPGAFHGGASYAWLGVSPSRGLRSEVITADVLDAWFPPSPRVESALATEPAFQAGSSPPTYAEELRFAIGAARGVDPARIVTGAGLSDLIFRALPRWVRQDSRVLLVEPQYSEYAHVLRGLIGCQTDSLVLQPDASGFADPAPLGQRLTAGYDLVVVVEPNNPVGCCFPPGALLEVLAGTSDRTLIWVDETYVDFANPGVSLEVFAAQSTNVVIGKSMSKAYALSGLRVGYLCAPPQLVEDLWSATPPWNVSRPAQAAAIAALGDPDYYAGRYRETAELRRELETRLAELPGVHPYPGIANFVLCDLEGIDAPTLVELSRRRGLFIRHFPTNPSLRWRAVRIAVKDRPTNDRMIDVLGTVLRAQRTIAPHLASAESAHSVSRR
jgi:histidinol-phosphate/aromatic aminotransferase/cobyric acid decarboxylase-like protein/GNAT superfamily N-acetyltransferase